MKRHLAVFDMDGTIYRSDTSFIPAVKKILLSHGFDQPPESFLFSFIGEPDQVFMDWLGSITSHDEARSLYDEFQSTELEMVRKDGKLYDGAGEILQALKEKQFTLAVCSNATDVYIKTVLEKFALNDLFSDIRVPSAGENKNEMLREIGEKFPAELKFMTGDRIHDMKAAEKNGFIFVGALYGFGGTEIQNASNLAGSPAIVMKIIDRYIAESEYEV